MLLGYLYSRYPVISQTFCDAEMLALERLGLDLTIGSIYSPLTSLRHEHISSCVRHSLWRRRKKSSESQKKKAKIAGTWPQNLVERHDERYGPAVKAEQRARKTPSISPTSSRATGSIMCMCILPIARRIPQFF